MLVGNIVILHIILIITLCHVSKKEIKISIKFTGKNSATCTFEKREKETPKVYFQPKILWAVLQSNVYQK